MRSRSDLIRDLLKFTRNHKRSQINSDKTNQDVSSRLKLFTLGATMLATPLDPNQDQRPPQSPFQGLLPIQTNQNIRNQDLYINWNDFCYQMLAKGEVQKVVIRPGGNIVQVYLHDGAVIKGQRPFLRSYFLQVPNMDNFEKKLRDFEKKMGIAPGQEVPIVYERSSPWPALISTALLIGLLFGASRNIKLSGPQNIMSSFSSAKFTLVDPLTREAGSQIVKFKDVAGLKEAKQEVQEFVDYLKNSEKYLRLGAKLPKGVLLLGPPGCGKTMLAKAVASESNVPFLALSGSDFVEMIGGVGASRVRNLFKQANKLAPCIIYIDEIDSIGKKRSTGQYYNGEMERTLNQLLVEMDGLVSLKSVILLASTNRADVLDAALLRPGRFDRQILIDLPTLEERREIFERHAAKIKLDTPASELALRIAQLTPGMSGADLANVCNEAALHAARKDKTLVASSDIEYAIERVVGGTEKRSNSLSAAERRIIAYHESGHALAGWLLKHADPLLKVTIVPRTNNVLGFAQYTPTDRKLHSPDQIFDRMCMALGGRVAELIKFNHLSTGAQDDLKKVTEMALIQIKEYGFDKVIGNISFPKEDREAGGIRPYSKKLANVMDHRASILVRKAFEKTHKLLTVNVDKLNLLAENLLIKESMDFEDVVKLIGPRPHGKSAPT